MVITVTRLLRIEAPHFVAGMEFTRTDAGQWQVTQTAPILVYMQDWSPERIKAYLVEKGWTWEWLHEE